MLFFLLTHLEGTPLRVLGVSSRSSMHPLISLTLTLSMYQTLSSNPISILASEYSILRFGIQPTFILPPQMGSQTAKFTMPSLGSSIVLPFEDRRGLRNLLIWVF